MKYIMVFNDSLEIQQLFADILTPEGYQVTLHGFGEQDLDLIRSRKPTLVVADCAPVTGEKTGWQLVQKLRMDRETENLPVVICSTSLGMIHDLEAWLTEKGIVALPKPFTPDELLRAIEKLIGKPDAPGLGPLADATFNAPPPPA